MHPWDAIKSDTHRRRGHFAFRLLAKEILTCRNFRVIATMRLCQWAAASRGPFRVLLPGFDLLHHITTYSAAVDLPWCTKIGGGFTITHGWCIVVNGKARIGSNVTLFHGVTLGRSDKISPDGSRLLGYPTLEDEVWVGPNAIIVGGVTIGRGSRITGGAFVTENVPPYSIVSGNPAEIVKSNCTPDVLNRAPI